MKILITFILSLFVISCAHHDQKPEHHHHAYEKQCAYSVLHGDMDMKGKEEYSIQHAGKVYYFSTLEKKNKFENKIEENIKSANKSWGVRGRADR